VPLRHRAALAVLGLLAALPSARLRAQTDSSVAARLDSLEQAVKVLARLRELEKDSAGAAQAGRASVSIGADGFQFKSADGAFRLKITGDVQTDGRFYLHDAAGVATDAFLIRRARPMIEGTIFKYFDFRLMPDFGQGSALIYEAYFDTRISRAFVIRAGKVKPPIGLERLQADVDVRFAERGYPTNLVPNRDIGFQIWVEGARGTLQYAVGVFDGLPDLGFADGDVSDSKDFAGRLFLVPFASREGRPVDLGIGVGVSAGDEHGNLTTPATSNLRSAGQLVVFKYRSNGQASGTVIEDGRRTRIAPQAYLYHGAFGALAEYTESKHTIRLDQASMVAPHTGWQVAASVVAGGSQSFTGGVKPRHPFDPSKNAWGALEFAARYEETQVTDDVFPVFADPASSVRSARTWSIGLTWHLLRRTKIVLDYEHTTFAGGAPNGDRTPENFLVTRFQLAY